ncbi:D-aminoacid aminotransferase-like PLP-dependent enzyme [Hesseltinella vesiculosa]|uniref:D-aminoacid aminotransferase-like PLP-dependent enzyme n=1 Tax=Hesseltinella vesiculosa TaxID=101127 RepID=A0A1X2GIK5_9FUNG|nr:D-aminoacid aminotransferase-like PLP-dependent enzyme [Hesseltinella vesiculosa]
MVAFQLLETILYNPQDGFYLLDHHLDRLGRSAHHFDFAAPDRAMIREQLDAQVPLDSPQRVRLLYDPQGGVSIEHSPLPDTTARDNLFGIENLEALKIKLDTTPTDTHDVFLQHKTTNRRAHDLARERTQVGHGEIFDVVLWNKLHQVTETSIANIAIRCQDTHGKAVWLTPSAQCGLLPGTFRQHLLDQGIIVEAEISTDDLIRAQQRGDLMICFNSVRKVYRVVLV